MNRTYPANDLSVALFRRKHEAILIKSPEVLGYIRNVWMLARDRRSAEFHHAALFADQKQRCLAVDA
jgi:hypothetical protein